MAEDRFWKRVRLTLENMTPEAPAGHVAQVHVTLEGGESFPIASVRPFDELDTRWAGFQTPDDDSRCIFVPMRLVTTVEVRYVRGGSAIGFRVDESDIAAPPAKRPD